MIVQIKHETKRNMAKRNVIRRNVIFKQKKKQTILEKPIIVLLKEIPREIKTNKIMQMIYYRIQ